MEGIPGGSLGGFIRWSPDEFTKGFNKRVKGVYQGVTRGVSLGGVQKGSIEGLPGGP